MDKRNEYLRCAGRLLLFAVAGVIVLLCWTRDSSLLYPQSNYDLAVFRAVGEGWLQGLIPYRDMFDHKGPLVYLIQMAGIKLWPGKTGVWLLEVLNFVVVFELIYRIGVALRASWLMIWLALAACCVGFSAYVDGGCGVEEWSLPFELVSVWLLVRCVNSGGDFRWLAFWTGLCFGFVALIRVNDNCTICGILLGMLIYLCYRREWRILMYSCLAFLGGLTLALGPFVVYFYAHDALSEFVYCNLTFNLRYKQVWGVEQSRARVMIRLLALSPCVVLAIASAANRRNLTLPLALSFAFIGVVTFMVFLTGECYGHYFIMVIPVIALTVLSTRGMGHAAVLSAFLLAVFPSAYVCCKWYKARLSYIRNQLYHADEYVEEGFLCIPKDDLDSVYIYDDFFAGAKLLDEGGLPAGKYFFLQNDLIWVDPGIEADMRRAFDKANPKWIVSRHELSDMKALSPGKEWCLSATDTLCGTQYNIYRRGNR